MTSSSMPLQQQGRDCIVSAALNDAKLELDNALKKLLSNGPKMDANEETTTTSTETLSNNDNASDDPDDLAAAFFATQAKPPKLPVDDWVQVILYKKNVLEFSSIVGDVTDEKKTNSNEDWVDSLYKEFQQAVKGEGSELR